MSGIDLQPLFSKESCFWCDGPMFDRETIEAYPELHQFRRHIKTRDHLVPLKDGGAGFTVPCCFNCNHAKGSLDPMEFRDKYRPDVPVEKVVQALLDAKLAHVAVAPRKKRVTKRRRVVR
jgi:hypothetical protein